MIIRMMGYEPGGPSVDAGPPDLDPDCTGNLLVGDKNQVPAAPRAGKFPSKSVVTVSVDGRENAVAQHPGEHRSLCLEGLSEEVSEYPDVLLQHCLPAAIRRRCKRQGVLTVDAGFFQHVERPLSRTESDEGEMIFDPLQSLFIVHGLNRDGPVVPVVLQPVQSGEDDPQGILRS